MLIQRNIRVGPASFIMSCCQNRVKKNRNFLVQLSDSAWVVVQTESLSLDQTGSVLIFLSKNMRCGRMKLCSINILSRRVLLFEACVVLKRVDPPTVVVASSRTVGDCVGSPPPVLAQSPRARRIQGMDARHRSSQEALRAACQSWRGLFMPSTQPSSCPWPEML